MRVSIAMAVYNGELFLHEQLESFLRQTRLPDELVVSDDASTDLSVKIVRGFAKRAPFPVRLLLNDENLGCTKNFERAIRACQGESIYLSDCDDVWYPNKICATELAFSHWPMAGAVISDADLVDENLVPIGGRLWAGRGFRLRPSVQKKMAEGKTFKRATPAWGPCIAFRAKLKPVILPLPNAAMFRRAGQDQFIVWTIAYSGSGGVALIPEALLAYRQHGSQMVGASSRNMMGALIERANGRKFRAPGPAADAVRARLEAVVEPPETALVNPTIRAALLRHWAARSDLPNSKLARIPVVIEELMTLRYHRFSNGFRTAAKDLLFVS